MEADAEGIVSEADGNPGDQVNIKYNKDPEGDGYSVATTILFGGNKKTEWNRGQIPIKYDNQVYGGITESEKGSKLYVGALHLFRFDLQKLSIETEKKLKSLIPILIKKSATEYFDIVIFVDRDLFAVSAEPERLRALLQKSLSSQKIISDGMSWISPHQLGKQKSETASQYSRGLIAKTVSQFLNNKNFSHFYLGRSEFNYSSRASSGAIIFSEEDAEPLGVLQCQLNKDLHVHGAVQNTMGLYQVLSFDVLNKFAIEPLIDSTDEGQNDGQKALDKLFNIGSQIISDPDCDWRDDGKMGGGN
jgi:hypothetical protein